jgi:glycosyltransferase involved in cell wall biosynthesis
MMRILSLHIGFLGVGGGIASAARSLIDELAGRNGGTENEVIAHSLLGHESMTADLPKAPSVTTRGFDGDKVRFTTAAFATAHTFRPDWLFVDHISLMPAAYPVARSVGARLALFLHGTEIYGPRARPDARTYTPPRHLVALARRADALFANSPWTARLAHLALGLETAPTVSWLPVEERKADHIRRATVEPPRADGRYLLMVSRIDRGDDYKGHDELLDALCTLPPELRLRIVGAGGGAEALRDSIRARGLDTRVEVLGYVSDAELARLYANADGFVMLSAGEGLGLVYLEALLAGIPVLGWSPGPIDDLEAFGANAVHALADLPDALAAILARAKRTSPNPRVPFRLRLRAR